MKDKPIIDEAKCDQCGLCVSICTCGAIAIKNHAVTIIKADDCGWCTMCELVCPTGAISCPYEIVMGDD